MKKMFVMMICALFGALVLASCHDNREKLGPCQTDVSPRETRLWCRATTTVTVDGNPYTTKLVLTKCVMDFKDYGGSASSGDFYWFWGKQALFDILAGLNECASPSLQGKYSAELLACEPAPKNPYKPSDGDVWPLAVPLGQGDVFKIVADRVMNPETIDGASDAGVERHPRDEAACDACANAMCSLNLCTGNANCLCWLGCAAAGNDEATCAKLPGAVPNVTTCGPQGTVTAAFATCAQTACAAACLGSPDPMTCDSLPMVSMGSGAPACTAFGETCGLMFDGTQKPPCCDSVSATDDACVSGVCQ